MKLELLSASNFLVHLIRLGRRNINDAQLDKFRAALIEALRRRYRDHWFPEKPCKGSGYRCIRINGKMDPVISQAGEGCGLSPQLIHSIFPTELTMWIDPLEVSYRIGENGSICLLYEFKEGPGAVNEPWKPTMNPLMVGCNNNKNNSNVNNSPSKNAKNDNEPDQLAPTPPPTLAVAPSTPCKDSLRKMDYILDPRKSLSSIDQLAAYVAS